MMRARDWSIAIYLTYAVFSGLLTIAAALGDNPLAAVGFTGVGLLCMRWAVRDLKALESEETASRPPPPTRSAGSGLRVEDNRL